MNGMHDQRPPLVILAGSDRRAATLPEKGPARKPLTGHKAFEIRIGGRPMIEHICERCAASGSFARLYVAGPQAVYGRLDLPADLIDTDSSFGHNIRAGIEGVAAGHPGSPVAFITCDILPEVETIQRLMREYREAAPCDIWFPMVRIPESSKKLGASEWKPTYRIVPEEGQKAVGVLPGHLVIADPAALRLRFLYRLFQIGYKTRNRPIRYRRAVMLRKLLLELFYQDILHIVSMRLPNLTWTMLKAALPVAEELKAGTLTQDRLENAIRKIFVKFRHRRRFPERRILFPQIDDLSLALDIDTEEEARAMGGEITENSA